MNDCWPFFGGISGLVFIRWFGMYIFSRLSFMVDSNFLDSVALIFQLVKYFYIFFLENSPMDYGT